MLFFSFHLDLDRKFRKKSSLAYDGNMGPRKYGIFKNRAPEWSFARDSAAGEIDYVNIV